MSQGPATSRRRLGAELKRYRDEAGMTLEQAAEALECSTSKISRLENGKGLPKQRDVRDLVRLYGKRAESRLEHLLRLVRDGSRAGWWQDYTKLIAPDPFVLDSPDRYVALESDASRIKSLELAVFHGLLQSPAYARAVVQSALPFHDPVEIEQLVEFRVRRQRALRRLESPLQLHHIVDEAVVRRTVASNGEIARQQFLHLLQCVDEFGVVLQVLPFSSGFSRALGGPFAVIEFEDSQDQDVVFVEAQSGGSFLDGDFGVETFKRVFSDTASAALGPEETRALIEEELHRMG